MSCIILCKWFGLYYIINGRTIITDADKIKALFVNEPTGVRQLEGRQKSLIYRIRSRSSRIKGNPPHQSHKHMQLFAKSKPKRPISKRIITGDEKWIVYDNVVRNRSWTKQNTPPQSTSKTNSHQRKITFHYTTV